MKYQAVLVCLVSMANFSSATCLTRTQLHDLLKHSSSETGFNSLCKGIEDIKASEQSVFEYLAHGKIPNNHESYNEILSLVTAISFKWKPDDVVRMITMTIHVNRVKSQNTPGADETFLKTQCLNILLDKQLSNASKSALRMVALDGLLGKRDSLRNSYFKVLTLFGSQSDAEFLIDAYNSDRLDAKSYRGLSAFVKLRAPRLVGSLKESKSR